MTRDVRFWVVGWEEEKKREKNNVIKGLSFARFATTKKKKERGKREEKDDDDDDQSSSRAPRLFDGFSGDTASFMFLT